MNKFIARLFLLLFPFALQVNAQNNQDNETPILKVCADPYMLPFSSKEKNGYENKIADLFAEQMGATVQYEWFPQRMGFIRNTLRADVGNGQYKCDLVISVPESFELAATTEPYYTSTYVLVYAKGRGLDEVTEPDMLEELVNKGKDIKFGLSDRGPAQLWVFKHGLMGNMVPYAGQPGDPTVSPGELALKDLAAGKIDVTIVWGPTAGYFAKQLRDQAELVLLPLKDDPEMPEMKFEYSFAMAVRYGEKEWKDQVNNLIKQNQDKINTILTEYGIPLLPLKKSKARDDD